MKIILLQTHEKLGQIGEIVNVKSGYARNFLIPNKIASIATDDNIQYYNKWIENQKIKEAKNRKNLELLSNQLDKLTLKFELKAGENDKLFGSVTSQMISDELDKKGYSIDKKEIVLDESLKEIGNHFVYIHLNESLKPKIKVKIAAEK
ncbi:MAG: 50S ribosomal protein L9 [Candidatus Marinimicrobia bacterium]|nr:50S ribosomal protein L9 [Candidatus Neomarinimicrobiota bacterium]|tara:strand:- start:5567 stop:6013 length:447 start_codon:yes stop_codon:yes gene_type:complete